MAINIAKQKVMYTFNQASHIVCVCLDEIVIVWVPIFQRSCLNAIFRFSFQTFVDGYWPICFNKYQSLFLTSLFLRPFALFLLMALPAVPYDAQFLHFFNAKFNIRMSTDVSTDGLLSKSIFYRISTQRYKIL